MGGRDGADNARIGPRIRVEIDNPDTVRALSRLIESRHVSKLFWRCFGRQPGRRIEARIGLRGSHRVLPLRSARYAMAARISAGWRESIATPQAERAPPAACAIFLERIQSGPAIRPSALFRYSLRAFFMRNDFAIARITLR